MTTNTLHIGSSWIPIALLLPACGFLLFALRKPDSRFRKISFWLFILGFFTVLFTCGMGGASMRMAESIPDTNIPMLKAHAWTSMGAFLISLAWLILLIFNRKDKGKTIDITIIILSVVFFVLYTWTIFEANGIR